MKKHREKEADSRAQAEYSADTPQDNLFNRASGKVHGYSSRIFSLLRLSIGLRTSIGYSLLLLRMFIPLAIMLSLIYGWLRAPSYEELRQKTLRSIPDIRTHSLRAPPSSLLVKTPPLPASFITPLDDFVLPKRFPDTFPLSGSLVNIAKFSADLLPSIITVPVEGVQAKLFPQAEAAPGIVIYQGWGLHWGTDPFVLHLAYSMPFQEGRLQVLFSLQEDWRVLSGLLLGLFAMVLYAMVSFLARGKKLNGKLLQPLQQITETTQSLSEKDLSARINVAGTQNELRDLAVVINDMLDRIEAAYNRQKQFVSDASHELRTPIAVLQGYAGLLERWGKDNPDVRDEAIQAIASETDSMKVLVENLLFLARHDKKTLSLTFESFESEEMLHELIKDSEIIVKEHRVLTGSIAKCTLVADRTSVKQAVRIFVENATKYTPLDGSIEISSKIVDNMLRITVKDSGCGIKRADLSRIFDRFYRTDDARGSQAGGHGLGLSIARIIAISHGGKIHVSSQPGIGSAFTLVLPLMANT